MAFDLSPFEQWAEKQAIDLAPLSLRSHIVAVWDKEDTSGSGALCDHYRPVVAQVDLMHGTSMVASLGPLVESSSDEGAFASLRQAIEDEGQILNPFERVVIKGSPVPVAQAPHTITWTKLSERVKARHDMLESMIRRDPVGGDAAAFRRFQQSDAFAARPCDSTFYSALRREFFEGSYMAGMGFGDYYAWFHRSAELLNEQDGLTDDAKEEATRMLTAWSNQSREMVLHFLHRNMEVHPRHEVVFEAFADHVRESQALRAVDAAPSVPTPRRSM